MTPPGVLLAKRATRLRGSRAAPKTGSATNPPEGLLAEKEALDKLQKWTRDWQLKRERSITDGELEELLKVVPQPEVTFRMQFPHLFTDKSSAPADESSESFFQSDDEYDSDPEYSYSWGEVKEGCIAINSGYDPWPLNTLPAFFLCETDPKIRKKYDYPRTAEETGKWMLFYDHANVNEAWRKARLLYRAGELEGIEEIEVSTGLENPRALPNSKTSVVIFFCGPASNEELMRRYGRSLIRKMEYEEQKSCREEGRPRTIAYKTDLQTYQGTAATGCKKNWTYLLPY